MCHRLEPPSASRLRYATKRMITLLLRSLPSHYPAERKRSLQGGFGAFFLHAVNTAGQAVHHFARPVTLTVRYTPQQLQALHIAEDDLTLFWYDEQVNNPAGKGGHHAAWLPIATTLDRAAHTATALVDHFSAFQLSDGSSPSAAYLPSLQGWQVNTFTGAATYQHEIEVPTGPGGLKPQLQLSYNSGATDGATGVRQLQQASWVGKGWSLDTGMIARTKIPVDPGTDTWVDTYSLAVNGTALTIVRAGLISGYTDTSDPNLSHWNWKAIDEQYVKIQAVDHGTSTADANGHPVHGGQQNGAWLPRTSWLLWTKDGTRYEFSEDLWYGWDMCAAANQIKIEAYKWLLHSVTDTHQNTITYTYGRKTTSQPVSGSCDWWNYGSVASDYDAWPTSITWGANPTARSIDRYQVQFLSADRTNDTQYEGADNQLGRNLGSQPHETQLLQAIKVLSKRDDTIGWELVRQYNFGADYHLYTDALGATTYTSYPKLRLNSIQQVGKDGTTALPLTTFTYGTTYTDPDPTITVPKADWNRLNGVNNGQGGTVSFSYEQISVASRYSIFNNYRRVTTRTVTDGQSHSYTWTYSYAEPELNSIGSILSFSGDKAQTHPYPNSAALYYNKEWDPDHPYTVWLATQEHKEFRGHHQMTETAPDGTQTQHWFIQGDKDIATGTTGCVPTATGNNIIGDACFQQLREQEALKGREYDTRILGPASAGSLLLAETKHQFKSDLLDYTTTPLTGLWRAWNYETQAVEMAWEGTSASVAKTTNYFYDTSLQQGGRQYGNLTHIDEYDQSNTLIRSTFHSFNTLDDGTHYIVDRPDYDLVNAGNTNHQALMVYMYDGATTSEGVTSQGQLTLKRVYYDVPDQPSSQGITLHSTDTTFGYDTYGNRTAVTVYAQPGTRLYNGSSTSYSGPGNGSTSWTTTTTYDGTFHALPTQVDSPSVNGVTLTERADYDYQMGTLTSVTDPNNNTTTAQYDRFGRMTKLFKPGDPANLPSRMMTYYDTAQPFHYLVQVHDDAAFQGDYRELQQFYDGLGRQIQTKSERVEAAQNIVADWQYDGLGHVIRQSQPHYLQETSSNTFYQYTSPTWVNPTTTTYDGLGRPLLITNPDTTMVQHRYGIYVNGTTHWDSHAVIDANSHQRHERTDALGRLVQVVEDTGNGSSSPWASYATTLYSYSSLDLLTTVTDTLGDTTRLTYDTAGRKLSMHDPDMGDWTYTYDVNGNLQQQRDAKLQRIVFSYDALNRLTTKTYPDTPSMSAATYHYDEAGVPNGKGQRTSMTNAAATTQWQYDARGHQVRETWTIPGMSSTRGLARIYDSAERVATIQYLTNNAVDENVDYTYDAA
ncbi:MAG: hypothetical protein H0X37_04465 [Herpetosiphonaceae bacterium]|nr:hypothetical protein [Herpetosiphonaceae bacterium]